MNRNVDAISLREPESGEELKRLGVSNPDIILSADPALILDPSPPSEVQSAMLSSGLSPQDRYIAFIPRDWVSYPEKADIIGRAAEYAFEKHNLTPVFIPLERGKDEHAVSLAIKNIKHVKPIVIPTPEKTSTLIGILARMEAVVSMRLHGLIFAAGQGVPLVGIAYDTKVGSFLSYMEQDLCLPLEDVNEEVLFSLIDRALQKDRTKLASAVEGLRAIEYKNRETARELLSNK
jgi:polysaccharide pyruvyl transferase WcaK-like protein